VTIKGGPDSTEVKVLPKHKKNPDVGEKKTVFTSNILVEQEDALSFQDQEEVRSTALPLIRVHADTLLDHPYGLGKRLCSLQDRQSIWSSDIY